MNRLYYLLLLASWAVPALSQASCLAIAIEMPICANTCLQSAGQKAGCELIDFACQCGPKKASIDSMASSCVLKSCGAQTALLVSSSQANVCNCATSTIGTSPATTSLNVDETPLGGAVPTFTSSPTTIDSLGSSIPEPTATHSQQTHAPTSGPRLAVLLPAILVPVLFILASIATTVACIIIRRRRRQGRLRPSQPPNTYFQPEQQGGFVGPPYGMTPAPGPGHQHMGHAFQSQSVQPNKSPGNFAVTPMYSR